MKILSRSFKDSFDKSLASILVPYLDSIVYNLDKIKENSPKALEKQALDAVDDLF